MHGYSYITNSFSSHLDFECEVLLKVSLRRSLNKILLDKKHAHSLHVLLLSTNASKVYISSEVIGDLG